MSQKLLTLSDLRVIGPFQISPHAGQAMQIGERYCRSLGIWRSNFHEYASMSAYLFPRAHLDGLVAIDLLNNLLFYLDDTLTEGRASGGFGQETQSLLDTCTRILREGYTPAQSNPVFETCKTLRPMIQRLAPPGLQERLVRSLRHHFMAASHDMDSVYVNGEISVEKYIELREHDSGMHPTLDLLELGLGIHLPDHVLHEKTMHSLRQCTIRIGSLMNDLFSYEKEVLERGQRFNLVNVLMEARAIPFPQAVHESIVTVNHLTDIFLALENQLPDWANPQLNQMAARYVEGLRDQIIACWQWQISTNRYKSATSPFPELRLEAVRPRQELWEERLPEMAI